MSPTTCCSTRACCAPAGTTCARGSLRYGCSRPASDSATATQIVELLRELTRERGVAAVVATHDERMTRHCDRVLHLVDGAMQGTIQGEMR